MNKYGEWAGAEVRMDLGGSVTLIMGVCTTPLDDLRHKLWRVSPLFL